jgi:carboxypeptidase Taq
MSETALSRLVAELRRVALFGSCEAVLGWDEQTYLPPAGGEHRANQLSLLAGMRHEMATAPKVGELIAVAEAEVASLPAEEPDAVIVSEARRQYDRATKLPQTLVEEMSRACSLGQQAWIEARKEKNFPKFLPWLEKIVALKREEARLLWDGNGEIYDALLDAYEPGASTAEVATVFDALRPPLVALLQAIVGSSKKPDPSILTRHYPQADQREFSMAAAKAIGFDFNAGRLDIAAHPFCSGFGPGDVRLTTRYDEHHFPGAFFGTLHEAGHGIYEQGLDAARFGTALGEAASLGIHESQSRMWENCVGRSRAFWQHFYPQAQQRLSAALKDVALDDFYRAVNDVRPSFIRVEADEVTYNLHIMLRFELERKLISGQLAPADVPAAWDERFAASFGLTPSDVTQGCIQDVHWSAGLIGYFPTYALGNMYAAQFFDHARQELGDLGAMFSRGEFAPLKNWLNEKIHRHGRRYPAPRLLEVVTGQKLSHEPLMAQLRVKYGEVYGL